MNFKVRTWNPASDSGENREYAWTHWHEKELSERDLLCSLLFYHCDKAPWSRQLLKGRVSLGLLSQRNRSPGPSWQAAWRYAGRYGAGKCTSRAINREQRVGNGNGRSLLKSQAHPQWYISSNKVTLLNPSQRVIPTGDQVLKYTSLGGPSHSNHHTWTVQAL